MTLHATPRFSVRDALAGLRHPGPPPAGLPAVAAVSLVTSSVTLAVIVGLGRAWHGDSHHFLREWQPGTYLSVLVLVASGVLCWTIAGSLAGAPFAWFWRTTALVFVWLAFDDLFLIHETVDWWIHRVLDADPRHPITRHLDDLIVAAYGGVLALWLAYRYRADLVSLRWMVLILSAGAALFAAMVLFDLFDWNKTVEESLKVLAGTVIFIGFYAARLQLKPRTG